MTWYKLIGRTPVKCASVEEYIEWARWATHVYKVVKQTELSEEVKISTVFLGLDHRHTQDESPKLFETMVFGGECDGDMSRCSTWEEAEKQHEEMVKEVQDKISGIIPLTLDTEDSQS